MCRAHRRGPVHRLPPNREHHRLGQPRERQDHQALEVGHVSWDPSHVSWASHHVICNYHTWAEPLTRVLGLKHVSLVSHMGCASYTWTRLLQAQAEASHTWAWLLYTWVGPLTLSRGLDLWHVSWAIPNVGWVVPISLLPTESSPPRHCEKNRTNR